MTKVWGSRTQDINLCIDSFFSLFSLSFWNWHCLCKWHYTNEIDLPMCYFKTYICKLSFNRDHINSNWILESHVCLFLVAVCLSVWANLTTLLSTNYTLAPVPLVNHHTLRTGLGGLGYPWGSPCDFSSPLRTGSLGSGWWLGGWQQICKAGSSSLTVWLGLKVTAAPYWALSSSSKPAELLGRPFSYFPKDCSSHQSPQTNHRVAGAHER